MLEDPEYQEMTEMNHNGVREKRDCEERTVGGVKRTTCRRVRREADAKNAVLEDVKDVDRCVGGKQSTEQRMEPKSTEEQSMEPKEKRRESEVQIGSNRVRGGVTRTRCFGAVDNRGSQANKI
jgi:hypothetical protein